MAHHLEQRRYKSATKPFLQFGLHLKELEKKNSKSLQKKRLLIGLCSLARSQVNHSIWQVCKKTLCESLLSTLFRLSTHNFHKQTEVAQPGWCSESLRWYPHFFGVDRLVGWWYELTTTEKIPFICRQLVIQVHSL